MNLKQIILLMLALFIILITSKTEIYQHWMETFLLKPDITEQFKHLGVEERKEYRFNNLYILAQYVKKTLDTAKKGVEPVVLLPPNDYLRENKLEAVHMPEPIEFYYHTGYKSVWTISPTVRTANWTIIKAGNSVALVPIKSKEELEQLLSMYKKYKATL